MKPKMLVGFIMDGKAGGVDKYILSLLQIASDKYDIDVLTNHNSTELKKQLKQQGIGLYQVPSLSHPIAQYNQIKKLIEEKRYDVAYLNTSTAIMIPMMVAAHKCKVPVRVVHSHSSGVDIKNKWKKHLVLVVHKCGKLLLGRVANKYIACSNKAGEWMFSKKIMETSADYSVIPNTVDIVKYQFNEMNRIQLRKQLGIKEELLLGHISNFQPVKNAPFLVEILKEITYHTENVKLLFVGDGPEKQNCMEKAKQLGVDDKIIDMGYQKNIADFYHAMDFFLLPSLFEGFPIVSIEAQASSVACIFSENITNEVKLSSKTYFLPTENAAKRWADCILENYPYERKDVLLFDRINQYDSSKLQETFLNMF